MSALVAVAGLVVLTAGAEALVRGASRIAVAAGISSVIVGLTVVAFGTGTPELAVSVNAARSGSPDLATGNVVGSNIINILVVLGIAALIAPLVVERQLVRRDVPIMIGASVLLLVLAFDGAITRLEGAALFTLFLAFTAFLVFEARREQPEVTEEYDEEVAERSTPRGTPWWVNLMLIVAGLGGLLLGANLFVGGAVDIAESFGVSEAVIGITVVAVGTSLPEIVTSLVAAVRGEREIAIANAIGSNVFNLLCVLGLTAMLSPLPVAVADSLVQFDIPVMVAVALACLPVFFRGYRITRWEGAAFLVYYVAFVAYLLLDATGSAFSDRYRAAMVVFVVPMTVLTLVALAVRDSRRADA